MNKTSISVFLAGDSTASNYPSNDTPRAGWGQVINRYFINNVIVKKTITFGRAKNIKL